MGVLRIGTVAVMALVFTGCATHNPVPISGKAPAVNKKEVKSSVESIEKSIEGGNVVFIRRYAQPTAYPISVRVDDKKVASLGQRKYTAIALPKGQYDVVAKWPFIATQVPIKFEMDVTGDGTQYFEFLGEVNVESYGFSTAYNSFVGAREIDPAKGAEYLSNCCVYVKPKK